MRKGFTLIELLAVIVILAIIALIATPIILGIINDAKEESNERSVELYVSAIRNGIAAYQLREMKEVAPGTYTTDTLPMEVEYEGDVECTTIDIYEDGGVYVEGCAVNDIPVEYTYGTKQEKVVKLSDVCKPANEQLYATNEFQAGYKYECKVDSNEDPYTFYVLNSTSTEVNLIMDSNINVNKEAVKEGIVNKGYIEWYKDEDVNSYGPITAMNYLQDITSTWINTNPQTINIFTSCEDKTNCIDKQMKEYKINARMPYYSELSDYNENENNAYLYEHLNITCWSDDYDDIISCDESSNVDGLKLEGLKNTEGILGYFTLSSLTTSTYYVWHVSYLGNLSVDNAFRSDFYGVRPVINLSI